MRLHNVSPAGRARHGRTLGKRLAAFALGTVCIVTAANAFSILKAFPGDPADGATPYASPVLDGAGNLYGMASYGGATNNGVIFKVRSDGTGYTILHNFVGGATDGLFPFTSALVLVGGDSLFGTTYWGGQSNMGTVFTIKTDGTGFAVLHGFAGDGSEGWMPYGGLVLEGTDTLFGTTSAGDFVSNRGTVFTIKTDGTGFAVLHGFAVDGSEGYGSHAQLILDGAGNLYGNTYSGGAPRKGTVFTLKTDGSGFAVLHSLVGASDGANPYAPLVLVGGDSLYGTTTTGGASNLGTVFGLKTDGTGFTVLHTFGGGVSDGATSRAGLTFADGALYGVTTVGGASDQGTLFRLETDGTDFVILRSFAGGVSDGVTPRAAPTFDGADTLYGPAMGGGPLNEGMIFKIKTDGSDFAIVHSFASAPPDGVLPASALVLDSGGYLYGSAEGGGTFDKGTVFKVKSDGSDFTVLHAFAGDASDGADPGTLVLDGAGTLYGTTQQGGAANRGTVFSLTTGGSGFTVLHSFAGGPSDGANPYAGLVLDGAGKLYGTTTAGGASNLGTVFTVTTGGTDFALLHSFGGGTSDGANPYGSLILDGTDTLYGTTYSGGEANNGTVFSLTTGGSGFAILHSLIGASDGANPYAGLVLDGAGKLYGTTYIGGALGGGTVFTIQTDATGFAVLHGFPDDGSEGANPRAQLLLDGAGNLYGDSYSGGRSFRGTVFAIKTDGTGFAVLHGFAGGAADGSMPCAGLILDGTGNLYGTTALGGGSDLGTVFSLSSVDRPAVITSAAEVTFAVGGSVSFTLTTTGHPVPSLGANGALPTGVTFTDNGDGSATLAGTPPAGSEGSYALTITAHNGIEVDAVQAFTLTVERLAGDVNSDGTVNVSDIFYLINNLFAGGPPPTGLADVNGDGQINVADVFYLINTLFAGGPTPVTITLNLAAPEYGTCGQVSINGYVGTSHGTITGMTWDWGDGTVVDSWFPAAHQYGSNGARTVQVTAHSTSGETRTKTVDVSITNADDPGCH